MSTKSLKIFTLRKIIREKVSNILDVESVSELEPVEDSWSGGDNLEHPIDHAAITNKEETVTSPETLSIVDDEGVFRVKESILRKMVRNIVSGD